MLLSTMFIAGHGPPQILRARGGLLHKVCTLLQWDPEARGGEFITLTPCVPRYDYVAGGGSGTWAHGWGKGLGLGVPFP